MSCGSLHVLGVPHTCNANTVIFKQILYELVLHHRKFWTQRCFGFQLHLWTSSSLCLSHAKKIIWTLSLLSCVSADFIRHDLWCIVFCEK